MSQRSTEEVRKIIDDRIAEDTRRFEKVSKRARYLAEPVTRLQMLQLLEHLANRGPRETLALANTWWEDERQHDRHAQQMRYWNNFSGPR